MTTVSLLSVMVLVFLFLYLNRYTGRQYFSLWTVGWVSYAAWLAIGPGIDSSGPLEMMLKHWCLGISATLLFWGSVQFLKLPSRPALLGLFMGFLPVFGIIGLASLVTAYSFLRLRKHREFVGAGLLAAGFALWGVYLGAWPFFAENARVAGTGFLISAVLQLFIAVSMIILVLEEARAANELLLHQITARDLQEQEEEDAEYQGVFDQSELSERLQRVREDLRVAQEQSLQQERLQALGQLSRGMAHDINNALTPILGYTNLIMQSPEGLPENVVKYVGSIRKAGERIAQNVATIRDFYRREGEAGALTIVDLNPLVRETAERSRLEWEGSPQSRDIRIDYKLELADELPRIMAREGELRESVKQLLFNGLEAMPEGGTVTVRTGIRPVSEEPGGALKVWVEIVDDGVGMTEEIRKRCLEPFFSTKERQGAKGLGLSQVYGMMRKLKGDIEIASEDGVGTTARLVFLPVQSGHTERFVARPNPAIARRLKILCIDDEVAVLDVLKMTLQSAGHEVEVAGDGQSGVDAFRAARTTVPFDVVVTDLAMPRMDGQGVAKTIKLQSSETPVILLTGWGGIMQAEGVHPEHVDVLLGKPPTSGGLLEALRKVTARVPQRAA
jgi:signal transduction histidine kinase/ActR/RegA family two-component response regulator